MNLCEYEAIVYHGLRCEVENRVVTLYTYDRSFVGHINVHNDSKNTYMEALTTVMA